MLNKIITTLKWPIALLMAWSFPASLMLFWKFISSQQYSIYNIPPILIGLFSYLVLWFFIFKRQELGSYLSTLEHECTHALFALLTGYSVKGMHITAHDGGHVVYNGGSGNWLITIAPYFFPTITAVLLVIRLFIEQNYWLEIGIGVSIGFHLGSTYFETHGAQTDLQEAGKFFSFCFLPTANILTYTFIGMYLQSGWRGIISGFVFLYYSGISYSLLAYQFFHTLLNAS